MSRKKIYRNCDNMRRLSEMQLNNIFIVKDVVPLGVLPVGSGAFC